MAECDWCHKEANKLEWLPTGSAEPGFELCSECARRCNRQSAIFSTILTGVIVVAVMYCWFVG